MIGISFRMSALLPRRDTGLYPCEASAASSPGRELIGGGAGRKEGLSSPSLPRRVHIPGVAVGWGLSSGSGAGFPFPLTLIDRKLGLILMVGGEACPPPPDSSFSCSSLPAGPRRRFREVSNSRGSLTEYENSEMSSFQPLKHLFLSSYRMFSFQKICSVPTERKLGTVLGSHTFSDSCNPPTTLGGRCHYTHFTKVETETQKVYMINGRARI